MDHSQGWKFLLPPGEGEDEGVVNSSSCPPHPNPLDSGSRLRSTSSVHGVVPEGKGTYSLIHVPAHTGLSPA